MIPARKSSPTAMNESEEQKPVKPCVKCGGYRRGHPRMGRSLGDCLDCADARNKQHALGIFRGIKSNIVDGRCVKCGGTRIKMRLYGNGKKYPECLDCARTRQNKRYLPGGKRHKDTIISLRSNYISCLCYCGCGLPLPKNSCSRALYIPQHALQIRALKLTGISGTGRNAKGPINSSSKCGVIRSPDNKTFKFFCLKQFVRDNLALFDEDDIRGAHGNGICRAYGGLKSLFGKRCRGSWKGWTRVSFTESFYNDGGDLIDRQTDGDSEKSRP